MPAHLSRGCLWLSRGWGKSEKQRGWLPASPATGKSEPCVLSVAACVVGACVPALSPYLEGRFWKAVQGTALLSQRPFTRFALFFVFFFLSYALQKHFFLRLYIPFNVLFPLIIVLEETKAINGVCMRRLIGQVLNGCTGATHQTPSTVA